MKESSFLQLKGYPGLANTAKYIKPLIPASKIYIEVFAGMGRTVEIDKHEKVILNDLSDYAVEFLRETYPTAEVTQRDYKHVIKEYYQNPDVFLFIDPPWRKEIYKNNTKPVFTHDSVMQYYDRLIFYLSDAKCKWILCSDNYGRSIGDRMFRTIWGTKVVTHPTIKLYGKQIKTRMISNMWSKIPN